MVCKHLKLHFFSMLEFTMREQDVQAMKVLLFPVLFLNRRGTWMIFQLFLHGLIIVPFWKQKSFSSCHRDWIKVDDCFFQIGILGSTYTKLFCKFFQWRCAEVVKKNSYFVRLFSKKNMLPSSFELIYQDWCCLDGAITSTLFH